MMYVRALQNEVEEEEPFVDYGSSYHVESTP